jgi:carbonic anhydrase/acetyltransferase-like protein (isoleucine patch superfamily)
MTQESELMAHSLIQPYKGINPRIGKGCFIAANAVVIGDVEIGDNTSIWHGCSIRGDVHYIRIGKNSNVQDCSVCHCTKNTNPLEIGDYVTIGHGAVVHGCVIGDHCLIGMNATILDGVEVGEGSIIAANALVPMGMKIPPRSLVAGVPAKIKKELTATDVNFIDQFAQAYLDEKDIYLEEGIR